jgi:hypothetical protein
VPYYTFVCSKYKKTKNETAADVKKINKNASGGTIILWKYAKSK